MKVVSERLGHANVAFTMNVYQHVLPGMQADAADALLASSPRRERWPGCRMTTVRKCDRSSCWLAEQDVEREVQREVGSPGGHPVSGGRRDWNGETFAPGVALAPLKCRSSWLPLSGSGRSRRFPAGEPANVCALDLLFASCSGVAARWSWSERGCHVGGRIVGWGLGMSGPAQLRRGAR